MSRKKEKVDTSLVLFDVFYEDGSRASNRKVPGAAVGGLDDAGHRANHVIERARIGDGLHLEIDDEVAKAWYRRQGNVVTFTHTDVPAALSGKGVGSRLAKGALDAVRAAGLRVVAKCPFIAAYLRKHPEYDDLLTPPDGPPSA